MINISEKFDLKNLHLFNVSIEDEMIKMNSNYLKPINATYDIQTELSLGGNIEHKLIRAQLHVEIRIIDLENSPELVDSNFFSMKTVFFFRVENFVEVAEITPEPLLVLNHELLNIIGSVCYSTTRGIALARLANTKFSDCILPLIKPDFRNPES